LEDVASPERGHEEQVTLRRYAPTDKTRVTGAAIQQGRNAIPVTTTNFNIVCVAFHYAVVQVYRTTAWRKATRPHTFSHQGTDRLKAGYRISRRFSFASADAAGLVRAFNRPFRFPALSRERS
jgi:hypothetical protein